MVCQNKYVRKSINIFEAFHAKSDGLKNFNFRFPSFFDIF